MKTEPETHTFTIEHVHMDSGIWVVCSCGVRRRLRSPTTMDSISAIAQIHFNTYKPSEMTVEKALVVGGWTGATSFAEQKAAANELRRIQRK